MSKTTSSPTTVTWAEVRWENETMRVTLVESPEMTNSQVMVTTSPENARRLMGMMTAIRSPGQALMAAVKGMASLVLPGTAKAGRVQTASSGSTNSLPTRRGNRIGKTTP